MIKQDYVNVGEKMTVRVIDWSHLVPFPRWHLLVYMLTIVIAVNV